MRSILKQRPSATLVVAFVALFVALSAGAAADLPGIGVVTSGDIKNNTVRSKDVRNSSLLAKDFKAGELPAGPRGPQGATGAAGAQGAPGPVKLVYRKGTPFSIAPGSTGGFGVGRPTSAPNVVGGGYEAYPPTVNFRVVTSAPSDSDDADGIPDDNWEVSLRNLDANPVNLKVYAICTAPTSVEQAPDQL
jgi:hypothetical protein